MNQSVNSNYIPVITTVLFNWFNWFYSTEHVSRGDVFCTVSKIGM